MRLFAFLALALVSAAPMAQAEQERVDPSSLHISIGRWGAMLSEVGELNARPDDAPAADDDADVSEPHRLARELRETAWQFNLARSEMCARNDMPEISCGAAFAADWLAEQPDAGVSYEELDRRSEELGAAVMPFWDAVCDRAKKDVPQEEQMSVCPME